MITLFFRVLYKDFVSFVKWYHTCFAKSNWKQLFWVWLFKGLSPLQVNLPPSEVVATAWFLFSFFFFFWWGWGGVALLLTSRCWNLMTSHSTFIGERVEGVCGIRPKLTTKLQCTIKTVLWFTSLIIIVNSSSVVPLGFIPGIQQGYFLYLQWINSVKKNISCNKTEIFFSWLFNKVDKHCPEYQSYISVLEKCA